MTQASEIALIVIHPFGSYAKGAIITDPATIASVQASGRSGAFIQTVVPLAHPVSAAPSASPANKEAK